MSDDIEDMDDDTTAADTAAEKQNWRRKLEQDAEEGRKAVEAAQQARRELAFIKAGIDVDSPQGKLLAKAYEGEATAEAVKAFAVEHGVLDVETPAVPAEELAAHDRLAAAAGGATVQSDEQGYEAAIRNATTPQEVIDVLRAADPTLLDYSAPGPFANPNATVPLG